MSPRILAILATLSILAPDAEAQEGSDALVLGSLFCQLRPNGAEEPVRYLLTRAMREAIDRAYAASDAWELANPGDKPPMGDGVAFQSFPDTAEACQAANLQLVDGQTLFDVVYSFSTQQGAGWTDRVVTRSEGGLLLIDDILYGGSDFKSGLRALLSEIADGK